MKRKFIYIFSTLVVLCLMLQIQAGAQFKIIKSVISNGGGKIANSNNQMNTTLGQSLIGSTGDMLSTFLALGFWYNSGTVPIPTKNSPYPLHMPFQAGTTWQVGGNGDFYGEGAHSNLNNDFYATDWNRIDGNGFGQPVYPVYPGRVTAAGFDANYGNYVDVVHSLEANLAFGTIKTRYAHLNSITVGVGDVVLFDTQIGTVGKTGTATDAYLHLSFKIYNGSSFVSLSQEPSRSPSPMIARSGNKNLLWELKDGESRTVAAKQFFDDVPNGFWAKSWTDAAYAWGVMQPFPEGQGTRFSPDVPVDRAYAAYHWIKAYHGPEYVPPPATGQIFNDVPASHWAAAYIEQAFRDGFVTGTSTNPPLYSPDNILKRAEIAVLILRALHGTTYYPPTPIGIFEDCPLDYWGTKWAEQLYREGITSGCCSSPLQFCPENPVTRAEMAVFLLRAFKIYPKIHGGGGMFFFDIEVPTTWRVDLTIWDAGKTKTVLTFGQAIYATDGLDRAFKESELPPVPAPGTFDARFELPVTPEIGSLIDYRGTQQTTTTWKIKFQPGSAGYPITMKWNIAQLPPGDFILKDAVTGTISKANMKQVDSLVISHSAINQMIIEKTSLLTRTVKMNPDWNLISVPVAAANMHYKALFPDAASLAFRFDNGYVVADSLENGIGYWLKLDSPKNYDIAGYRVSDREIAVKAGWNMIGPLESDVAISDIITIPSGIIQSYFYGFDNGYKATTILQVGKGYWVKVSQAGKLKLPETSTLYKKDEVALSVATNPDTKANHWTQLTLVANDGRSAILYLASERELDGYYDLPPLPPAGVFDVRFSSGRFVENLSQSSIELLINSAQYPIKIMATNLNGRALNFKDGQGGELFNKTLCEGQEIWLEKNLTRLILTAIASANSLLPKQYQLSQNYPNPFNPISLIHYALPEAGHVRISVFNILGKKVADLVDEQKPAGYHQVEIDARNYASGIYYYVMKVNGFSAIKKMAILK